MRKYVSLVASLICAIGWAQNVKVEFLTPEIVHVVKGSATKTLVVTAQPQQVDVKKKENSLLSLLPITSRKQST